MGEELESTCSIDGQPPPGTRSAGFIVTCSHEELCPRRAKGRVFSVKLYDF